MDNDIIVKKEDPSGEENRYLIRWKSRQRMAWLSFWFMVFYTFCLWFALPYFYQQYNIPPEKWVENIADSSEWLYITFSSIILGYMGTTAWMVKGKKIEVNDKDF